MKKGTLAVLVGSVVWVVLAAACGGGSSATHAGTVIRVGDLAPPFTLPSAEGGTVSLSEFRGRKPVLLYFSMGPG